MSDREMIIRTIKLCHSIEPNCSICDYRDSGDSYEQCIEAILYDAYNLLKAQEPRLVTKEDFMDADEWGYLPVWCETVEGKVYCECITVTALDIEQGLYRYWTAKPTDEHRKSVKWNS